MANNDADLIRKSIRLIESQSISLDEALENLMTSGELDDVELDEAFGNPLGYGQMASLALRSAFNPQAKFKYYTGVYANALYRVFKEHTGNETPTGQDVVDYFTTAISTQNKEQLGNLVDRFGGGEDAVAMIVQRVLGSTDFSKQLSPEQMTRVFGEIGAALGRKAQSTSTRLVRQASDAQEQKVLKMMTDIRPFINSSANTLSLNKFAKWVENKGELGDKNPVDPSKKKVIIRLGFINYIKLTRSAATTIIPLLPAPFSPTNTRPMSSSQISEFIGQLDSILLSIVMATDQYIAKTGGSPSSTTQPPPTPTPQQPPTRAEVEAAIDDWIRKGYNADTIKTLLGMKIL